MLLLQFINQIFDFSALREMISRILDAKEKFFVKSDEEELDSLLKTEEDKSKFHKAIDELQKEGKKSKEIELGGRNVIISI